MFWGLLDNKFIVSIITIEQTNHILFLGKVRNVPFFSKIVRKNQRYMRESDK
jgi:hypothetical protein